MKIKLEIDSEIAALKSGETITLQKNSNLLSSADKITTSRSWTIKAPFNPKNHAIYKNMNLPSISSDWLKTVKPAKLWLEDLPIFNGKIALLSIGKDDYESSLIFDGMQGLSSLIADKTKIKDLGLEDVFIDWTKTAPNVFTNEDYGLYYYLYGAFENDSDKMRQSASVNFIYLLDRIAEHYGITIDTSELPIDRYLTLTKNLNAAQPDVNAKLSGWNGSEFTYASGLNNTFPSIRMSSSFFYTTSRIEGFLLESASKFSSIEIQIRDIPQTSISGYVFIHMRNDGAAVEWLSITPTMPRSYDWELSNIEDGDRVLFYLDPLGTPYPPSDLNISINAELNSEHSYPLSESLAYIDEVVNQVNGAITPRRTNQSFPILGNCDFTALELLKEVQLLFGMQLRPTGQNSIGFRPYTELDDKTTATDYSKQFVSLEKSEFKFGDWAKTNNYNHAPVGESTFGNASFLLDNYALPDEKTNKSIFGVTPTYTELGNSAMLVPQFEVDEDGNYVLQDVPIITSKLTPILGSLRLFCDEMQFDYIIANEPYTTLIDKLQDLRVCEIDMKLTALQYLNFDINKLFYIKSIGKYFAPITGDFNCKNGIFKMKALVV